MQTSTAMGGRGKKTCPRDTDSPNPPGPYNFEGRAKDTQEGIFKGEVFTEKARKTEHGYMAIKMPKATKIF